MPNDSCCYENQLLNEEGEQTLPTHSLKPTRVSWSFCLSISFEDGEQRVLVKVSRAEITAGEVHALPSLILWPAWPISQTLLSTLFNHSPDQPSPAFLLHSPSGWLSQAVWRRPSCPLGHWEFSLSIHSSGGAHLLPSQALTVEG